MTALLTTPRKKKTDDVYTGRRRPVLLFLLFLFIGATFWYHFEHRFANIERDRSLSDTHGLLNPGERRQILDTRALLREKWGLLLQVRLDDISVPRLPPNGLFVGVDSENSHRLVVQLPALLEKAVGSDYDSRMASRLSACLRQERVGLCVDSVLLDLVLVLEGGQENTQSTTSAPETAEPPVQPSREVRGAIFPNALPNAQAPNAQAPNVGDSYGTE